MTDIYSAQLDLKPRRNSSTAIVVWLGVLCALVVAMILIGGLTRLTDSGLSITEWKPVTGAVPPLSDAAWQAELEKYRQIPEYQLQNHGMSMAEFKAIYWWEWGHRFLGRLIGLAFAVPFLIFLVMRRISWPLARRLLAILLLGGLQGAVGWWMVSSGLVDRLDVSQYRLATHLGLALVILAALFWTILECAPPRLTPKGEPAAIRVSTALVVLIFVQIISGAFVAGLDAGMIYNTWPSMDGGFMPAHLQAGDFVWKDIFEDRGVTQFNHRIGAYLVLLGVTAAWLFVRGGAYGRARVWLNTLMAVAWLQAALGVATLLSVTALPLGVAHQTGAVLLLMSALGFAHDSRGGFGAKRFSGSESERST
ncbi:MAG: COX15/CtaA family protein [Euryhalocaulis sp.]|uniref:COX15/CtaA family protein n=1 Tax=Euryhalocaulis sp. TaxID=2744307 RepID=UPI0017B9E19F|nr:COX15/CtaA family protein [Euryhalocaulis sp.]MBA4802074.1 COX15/CtaA family protein [Euryhalocaulis sp.]